MVIVRRIRPTLRTDYLKDKADYKPRASGGDRREDWPPQAKGKIERSFQTFQNRLVTLMAHAKVSDWEAADSILQMEIQRQGRKILRTTGNMPSLYGLETSELGAISSRESRKTDTRGMRLPI